MGCALGLYAVNGVPLQSSRQICVQFSDVELHFAVPPYEPSPCLPGGQGADKCDPSRGRAGTTGAVRVAKVASWGGGHGALPGSSASSAMASGSRCLGHFLKTT